MSEVDWNRRFLGLADHVATWSKDPKKQVGAVIARGKIVVSMGYNGFPQGVEDTEERLHSPDKNKYVADAERNAIDFATSSLEGCTIYCSYLPCNDCAKAIIQKGITRVVTREPDENKPKHNWDITKKMFFEAGVALVFISG